MATHGDARPRIGKMMYRDFWESGYRVFPIYKFTTKGICECGQQGCVAIGKHPRTSNWQHTPVWDEDQIEQFEQDEYFDTGYGVVCRDLIVVDVDARNGGVASYAKLLQAIPEIAGAGLAVSTGSGGGSQHLYFKAPAGVSFITHHGSYPGIDFKSTGFVVGPGSAHASGGIYTADGTPDDIGEAPSALIELLRRPERYRADFQGHALDVSHADIAEMLRFIENNDLPYEDWLSVGMAIHHATQGTGQELWMKWSATSNKHDPSLMDRKWHSFGKGTNMVTLGTLVHHAAQGGWIMPVTFVPADAEFDSFVDVPAPDGLPFDIVGVDLASPPGFVGEVTAWVEQQGLRSRKRLSVAAALVSIGNIGGMRYIDDVTGATANIFAFCVAGSGSGKDAVLSAAVQLHQAAGVSAAVHGGIKSEQEMMRNLLEHQASFYVIDEVASLFSKIKNAAKSGNAAYLEGIPQKLMEAYSKTRTTMGTSGDVKRDVRKLIMAEMAHLEKSEQEPDRIAKQRASLQNRLDAVDRGIERPFLSFMGVTVPHKFGELMDFDMATNGFIGRSLIFNEPETVPRFRKRHKAPPMPEHMANYLRAIWTGGEFDQQAETRVENLSDPTPIETDEQAQAMLDGASDWFEDKAEESKGTTGLEALYMRAYEMVAKVSLILAIPERLRTSEHVRWAFALVKRDLEDKIRMVRSNDSDKSFAKDAMAARLIGMLGDEAGEPESVVLQRMTRAKFRKEDVSAMIETLVKQKQIRAVEVMNPRNKIVSRRFVLPDYSA